MRRIACRRVGWVVSAWVLSMGLTATAVAAPPASGNGRARQGAPEWVGPPIEVPPPCVADGSPSSVRSLQLEPPRVKVISIEAVYERCAWEPAGDRPAAPRNPR